MYSQKLCIYRFLPNWLPLPLVSPVATKSSIKTTLSSFTMAPCRVRPRPTRLQQTICRSPLENGKSCSHGKKTIQYLFWDIILNLDHLTNLQLILTMVLIFMSSIRVIIRCNPNPRTVAESNNWHCKPWERKKERKKGYYFGRNWSILVF